MPPPPPSKPCAVCGRTITWRKKWERDWDEVRYCSDACRRRAKSSSGSAQDEKLETTMRALLARTGNGKTICPSDVARTVAPDDWRPLMEPTRAAARRLVAIGEAEITQGGHVVDPSTAKGPIRIRPVR
ncbi:MAG: hypothetical protein QOC98_581 [Frankiaceae bacterium]|nr:hypothetical protein [Frankiaceae bacterium]